MSLYDKLLSSDEKKLNKLCKIHLLYILERLNNYYDSRFKSINYSNDVNNLELDLKNKILQNLESNYTLCNLDGKSFELLADFNESVMAKIVTQTPTTNHITLESINAHSNEVDHYS